MVILVRAGERIPSFSYIWEVQDDFHDDSKDLDTIGIGRPRADRFQVITELVVEETDSIR